MKQVLRMRVVTEATLMCALLVGGAVILGTDVSAQAGTIQEGVDSISSGQSKPLMETVGDLINIFLFLLGAVAVVMVIFGGFKYITSAGDSSAVTSAKNTILYAVVGLVVAASAYAIVNFALGRFNTPQTWADCMKMSDLSKRKQCQIDMIKADAPDVPTEQIKDGVIHQ